MPRNAMRSPGSGGARTGTPGQSYSNRTDLNSPKLPIATAPGQPYGAAGRQAAAQATVPMAGGPPVPPSGPPSVPSAPAGPYAPPGQPPGVLPGQFPALHSPSELPGQPVTNGAASGPGVGPQALVSPAAATRVSDTLNNMARLTGNAELSGLAQQAAGLGQ